MENPSENTITSKGSSAFPMENPFSFKVAQIFTGFGIGCGIGIGVGRPIYLGAIPALQQVMSATRGATDAFSGVGRHVNSSLRKFGMKNIEAGVGCGVGIGHGFGVGLALKPGVVHRMQSSIAQATVKLMMKMGFVPGLSTFQNVVPGSVQSTLGLLTSTPSTNTQSSVGSLLDLASKTTGGNVQLSRSNDSSHQEPTDSPYELKRTSSDISHGSRAEKVIDSFLQNPVFRSEKDNGLSELAENLRSENNVLQVLLKHQQAIQDLMEENRKLQQILLEDLKVPPSKLQSSNVSTTKSIYPCADCFECRRRHRKSGR